MRVWCPRATLWLDWRQGTRPAKHDQPAVSYSCSNNKTPAWSCIFSISLACFLTRACVACASVIHSRSRSAAASACVLYATYERVPEWMSGCIDIVFFRVIALQCVCADRPERICWGKERKLQTSTNTQEKDHRKTYRTDDGRTRTSIRKPNQ